ncbi:hypothetical protein L1049_004130 [Liquidambar formosana]|uniref:Uncharacterized protein n=1 Tax=Liquidambar formosana TaxID=63359 RepID=A0AAP0RNT5_LIQFO
MRLQLNHLVAVATHTCMRAVKAAVGSSSGGGQLESDAGGGGDGGGGAQSGGGGDGSGGDGGGRDGTGWHGLSHAEHIEHAIWSLDVVVIVEVDGMKRA